MNRFSKFFIPVAFGVCLLGFAGLGFSGEALNNQETGTAVGQPLPDLSAVPTPTAVVSAVIDSDRDGLIDDEETSRGTDPLLVDTDGDGYSDKQEVDSGHNPNGK